MNAPPGADLVKAALTKCHGVESIALQAIYGLDPKALTVAALKGEVSRQREK